MNTPKLWHNPLVLTDCYNLSHSGIKINTDWETSHLYNRKSGQILYGFTDSVSNFIKSITVTQDKIDEASKIAQNFGIVFPDHLFINVIEKCGGKIPLKIETLPDGTWCPPGTPFAQISNTVEGFGELVTYWEAIFLHSHFQSGCATESWWMLKYLLEIKNRYNYPDSFLTRLHSFGFRGHRSLQDAYQAGSAWSLFHPSTDDFHIGFHHPENSLSSIPALAHKVVSQFDDEMDSFFRAIDYASSNFLNHVALVIDTYDVYNVIKNKIPDISKYAYERGVSVILRPDSGDTWKQVVDIYDVVKDNDFDNITCIIGEGMSFDNVKKADHFFLKNNVPLTFVNYGVGSGFYKHIDRDTAGWALKTSFSNGKPRMKFSENPLKRSIPGKVKLFYRDDEMWVASIDEDISEENLYKITYHYDSTQENMPESSRDDILAKVHAGNHEQVFIRSTKMIKDMVKEFRNKYRK